jgi:RNA polymerase sigma factor (sigma-70 family)
MGYRSNIVRDEMVGFGGSRSPPSGHSLLEVVDPRPRIRSGEALWSRRYTELQPGLVRALAATVGSYAGVEDAVQDAFATGLTHSEAAFTNVGGWLYTVALRQLRRSRRREAVLGLLRLHRSMPNELDAAIDRIDLLRTLARLSQRDRELLIAKHYFGLSQAEISAGLGIPRGTVSAALSRAASRLRALEGRA